MSINLSRRNFTLGLGAGVALGALGGMAPARAAASGQVVVGTWGGDYLNLLQKYVADPLMTPKSVEVVFDTASDTVRKTKLMAERQLPRGSMDIACLSASGSFEMFKNGALLELDPAKIPNLKYVQEKLRTKWSVPHIYSGRVILYNPSKVKTAPTSYADLWNPAYAGKVGVIDIQYQTTIESAALINGGGMSNYEPGKEKLLELKKMGVKVYPTNEAMADALKTEEVWMCIMWKARGIMWQNAGIPIEIANPKEGVALYISDMSIAKNARNKEAAYAWMNAILDPSPQREFAKAMGYNPTVENADVPAELQGRIAFSKDIQDKYLVADQEYLAKTDASLQDWWTKVFKA
ncbi:MAG TPA: extracellular solute-binding protein [Stellaceae bacterium]|nr:extracellular solute-binding protein [Stellaceae bacterium]